MNKAHLIGRLTADAELRYNSNNIPYTRFTLAVNRPFTNASGEREADFISCLAWRKTAELICQYFGKGSELAGSGRIQTGSYDDKDGKRIYTTDIVIEEITFIGNRKEKTESESVASYEPVKQPTTDPFADFGEAISIDDNFLD